MFLLLTPFFSKSTLLIAVVLPHLSSRHQKSSSSFVLAITDSFFLSDKHGDVASMTKPPDQDIGSV